MNRPRTILSDRYRDLPLKEKSNLQHRFKEFSGRSYVTLWRYLTKYPPKAIIPFFEMEMGLNRNELWKTI